MKDIIIRPGLKYWIIKNLHLIIILILCFVLSPVFLDYGYIIGVGAIMVIGIVCWDLIRIKQVKYIVSEEQIIIRKGVFIKTTNYIEMYRVYDYSEQRNILESAINLMSVTVLSRDLSDPRLIMKGIPYDNTLVSEIRNRVENQKKRKNIVELNNPMIN